MYMIVIFILYLGGGGKRGKGAKDKKAEQANKDPKGIKKEVCIIS